MCSVSSRMKKTMQIPFNRLALSGAEFENMAKAVESGAIQGDGKFTRLCEEKIRKISKADTALLVNSGTAALDMAAILSGVGPGDEVIVPTYTFVSTVNAFVLRGAKPVFCDVHPGTLNIDEAKIEELITPKTKVIVPVHYAGVSCEMDSILEIAKRHGLLVVEDAAQGFNAYYRGRHLGTIGDLGALSFHGSKNVVCGEGGALLVGNGAFRSRAFYVREKGTNRVDFVEGKIDNYTWVDIGSSYIPSELVSAFLSAQLDSAEDLTRPRVRAWNRYFERLNPLQERGFIFLPEVPSHCVHNAHIFFIRAQSGEAAKALLASLAGRGVSAVQHYAPLHVCPMAERLGCGRRSLPVAENAAKCMLRMPIFASITDDEVDYVCDCVEEFYAGKHA